MTRTLLLALLALGLTASSSAQSQTDIEPLATPDSTEAAPTQLDPVQAKALYDEGVALLQAGDQTAALAKLDASLAFNPSSAATQLRRGQALTSLNRLEEARDAFAVAVELAEAADSETMAGAAQRALDQIAGVIESRAAAAAQAEADAEANATQSKVDEAIGILQGINITDTSDANFGPASDGFALLEQARLAGYDADLAAEYYAIALNAMARGADAVPYAETALSNADASADNSRLYILLGLANMSAGNADAAREAFEAVAEGQSWHGWAVHFLGQLDSEG